MAQGLFGGCTNYKVQSLEDILEDVENWSTYTSEVKQFMTENKDQLLSENLWNEISWNFQMIMESSMLYFETILSDLELIKKSIISDSITKREVSLLSTIGNQSRKYNIDYGQYWHEDYKNADCEIARKMYAEGRDLFVTLQDAVNAAERLEDYMKNTPVNKINIVGNVSSSQIQQGNINSGQTIVTETQFHYEEVLDCLKKIQEIYKKSIFDETFGPNTERVRQVIDETVRMVNAKEEPGVIRKSLQFLIDLASNVGSNVIGTGILSTIKDLHVW